MITNLFKNRNRTLILRGIIAFAIISLMIVAPSAVEAKLDNGKKIGHEKIKTNNGKSSNSNPVKLKIDLSEIINDSKERYACNLEKPCFLNLLIKFDNKIIEDIEVDKASFVTIDGVPNEYEQSIRSYEEVDINKYISQIDQFEKELDEIESENYLDLRNLGKNSMKLKSIGKEIISSYDLKNNPKFSNNLELIKKLNNLELNYIHTVNDYKKSIDKYQRNNDLTITKRLLINQIVQDSQLFENKIRDFNSIEKNKQLIKSELEKIKTIEHFRNLLLETAIEHDEKYGFYDDDNILLDTIEKSIESESWSVLNFAVDEMQDRYSNTEIYEKFPNFKNKIKSAINDFHNINDSPNVFTLKSGKSPHMTSGNSQNNHEITSKGLLKSIVKSDLKEISKNIKDVVNEHKNQQKQNYENALRDAENRGASSIKSSNANLGNSGQSSSGNSANAPDQSNDSPVNSGNSNGKGKKS